MMRLLLLLSFLISLNSAFAQMNRILIDMSIKELKELKFEKTEDRVFEKAKALIPPSGKYDSTLILNFIEKEFEQALQMKLVNNMMTEVDGKDYPTYELSLETDYTHFPFFQTSSLYMDVSSVKNKEGVELKMDRETMDAYLKLGVIEPKKSFRTPGSAEHTFWLNEEPPYESNITLKGNVLINYPTYFETFVFKKEEIGKTQSVFGFDVTPMKYENNIAILKVVPKDPSGTGFRDVKSLLLNKDNQSFQGYSSFSTYAYIYEAGMEKNFEFTEEEKKKLEERFPEEMNAGMVYVYEIQGNIDKVIFYKPSQFEDRRFTFTKDFPYKFE